MPINAERRSRFLPVVMKPKWLAPDIADSLLDFAIMNEASFRPSGILYNGEATIDPQIRNSLKLEDLGPFASMLRQSALDTKTDLEKALAIKPFEPKRIEIELAAHGDGAHFHRHIDTFVVLNRHPSPRILTLVLYLHRRPRRFSGGMLRFYALGGPQVRDMAPDHNLMIAFPSITPHSVEPVVCPDGSFADRRFAINLWIHG